MAHSMSLICCVHYENSQYLPLQCYFTLEAGPITDFDILICSFNPKPSSYLCNRIFLNICKRLFERKIGRKLSENKYNTKHFFLCTIFYCEQLIVESSWGEKRILLHKVCSPGENEGKNWLCLGIWKVRMLKNILKGTVSWDGGWGKA
jgi:hypothetical protein